MSQILTAFLKFYPGFVCVLNHWVLQSAKLPSAWRKDVIMPKVECWGSSWAKWLIWSELSPVSLAWSDQGYCYSLLDGMLFRPRSPSSISSDFLYSSLVPIHTPVLLKDTALSHDQVSNSNLSSWSSAQFLFIYFNKNTGINISIWALGITKRINEHWAGRFRQVFGWGRSLPS